MYGTLDYGRGCLLGNFSAELADHSSLIRERLAALFAAWTSDIETAVREAQADASIATRTDPADLAAFLLDAYEGALLRARVEKKSARLRQVHGYGLYPNPGVTSRAAPPGLAATKIKTVVRLINPLDEEPLP
ncbi:MAG: TetR family transcriptional regulator C-terminal domain-containing protein [Acetobacteraceae bacterium]